jgi:hypothetical protein
MPVPLHRFIKEFPLLEKRDRSVNGAVNVQMVPDEHK